MYRLGILELNGDLLLLLLNIEKCDDVVITAVTDRRKNEPGNTKYRITNESIIYMYDIFVYIGVTCGIPRSSRTSGGLRFSWLVRVFCFFVEVN